MKDNPRKIGAPPPLTFQAMRALLWDDITKLREGHTTAANVNATSNASGKIISSVKLEIDYAKAVGKKPNIAGMIGAGETPDQAST